MWAVQLLGAAAGHSDLCCCLSSSSRAHKQCHDWGDSTSLMAWGCGMLSLDGLHGVITCMNARGVLLTVVSLYCTLWWTQFLFWADCVGGRYTG